VYTPPVPTDIERAIDVKATFSVFDPWLKVWRELPFTFQTSGSG
jgi:hypothetical protein